MKFRFKLLLILCALCVAIYAATPIWLAYILTTQLPPGWQLEKLDSGYPGLSGIDVDVLRVKGDLQYGGISLAASDIRFTYRGLKTETDLLVVDVYLQATEDRSADSLTLNDLSLPITNLTGRLPLFSVNRLQLTLHPAKESEAFGPIALQLQELKLVPRVNGGFHLGSGVSLVGQPGRIGRVDVEASAELLTAEVHFPVARGQGEWLSAWLEQKDHKLNTSTRIHIVLDTGLTDQQWLDSILSRNTGDVITHVSGKLEAQADFTGQDRQRIEQLSLSTRELRTTVAGLRLGFDAELLATREDDTITIRLPEAAELRYQDKTGRLDDLLKSTLPGLQHEGDGLSDANILVGINSNSSFIFQTGTVSSIGFGGNINLGYTSSDAMINLRANDLNIEVVGFSGLDAITANGLLTLEWVENHPFTYTSDELDLRTDKLSLSSSGYMRLNHQLLEFEQAGEFEIELVNMQAKLKASGNWLALDSATLEMGGRLDFELPAIEADMPLSFYFNGPLSATGPVISLSGDDPAKPTIIKADELSITAELSSQNGELVSSGSGTFLGSQVSPQDIAANRMDIRWQDFDLLAMTGNLDTRTKAFSSRFEAESWSGFDLDLTYSLSADANVEGSGTLLFDAGPQLPIEFTGNRDTQRWNITLPPATIGLDQLEGLLAAIHVEIPVSIKLADGAIDLQGKVQVDEEITAKLAIEGRELSASMLESSVGGVNFRFDTSYGDTLSAIGPVSVTSALLAGGIDVLEIGADLNLADTETFSLQNLHADLFDGRLNLGQLQFLNNRIQETTAELSHIDLGKLLAFADIDGLDGSGYLEMSLPLGSDQTGIYIKNGTFNSSGPGHLAYTKEGVAGSNIGLQALENFQYQDLSGTLDYQSDGTYQIDVHIEGKNPDLYGGHPIVFNLGISGVLPELFESLFMTGDFEESILNQVRSR